MVSIFADSQGSTETLGSQKLDQPDNGTADVVASQNTLESGTVAKPVAEVATQPDSNEEPSVAADASAEDDEGGEEDEEDEEDVYVIESIVKHRKNKKSKGYEYLVRWEGYGPEDDTWEPHDNIAESASALVESYWEPQGGYEANRLDSPSGTKRKRGSNSADLLPSNAIQKKLRREAGAIPNSPLKNDISDDVLEAGPPPKSWAPPLELVSWETEALVETLEKDERNQLIVLLEWPKEKQKSRHSAEIVYKKMPQTMLRFFENHLVFKAAKE